jgi:RNA polymerase sigma-70 factor (ECF subfamily)
MSETMIKHTPTADVGDLWREFAAPLRGYLRARVRAEADADDLLQEVFVRIQRRLPELREPAKLQGWVYRIARNVVIDHYRGRKAHAQWDEGTVGVDDADADAQDPAGRDALDLTPTLRRFIAALPEEQREPLVRYEFQGESMEEIAAALGLTLTATKSRVRRARLQLRVMLDACCRFEFDQRGRVIGAVPKAAVTVECDCRSAKTKGAGLEPAG